MSSKHASQKTFVSTLDKCCKKRSKKKTRPKHGVKISKLINNLHFIYYITFKIYESKFHTSEKFYIHYVFRNL